MTPRARWFVLSLLTVVTGATLAAAVLVDRGGEPSATGPATVSSSTEPSALLAAAPTSPVSSPAGQSVPATDGATPTTLPVIAGDSQDVELFVAAVALLGVAGHDEQVAFLATNLPEDDVAQCMTASGFDYVQEASPAEQVAWNPESTMPADEFAATYGFGITARDLGLFPPVPPERNQAYRLTLTAGQVESWDRALFKCQGRTDDHAVRRSNAWNVSIDQFRGLLDADDRMVAALDAWRVCMAASGFEFESPMKMRELFYLRMGEGADLSALHAEEITVAVTNVPCEAAYRERRRALVVERFAELSELYDTAYRTGAAPDAQG